MKQAVVLADNPGINRAQPDSGTGLPAHESYGELLLETGKYNEAMQAFQNALQRTPNRLYSELGLARAAAAAGDRTVATTQYQAVLEQLSEADPGLTELSEAQRYIGTKP
jgi:predicted Zn-dependent protease